MRPAVLVSVPWYPPGGASGRAVEERVLARGREGDAPGKRDPGGEETGPQRGEPRGEPHPVVNVPRGREGDRGSHGDPQVRRRDRAGGEAVGAVRGAILPAAQP